MEHESWFELVSAAADGELNDAEAAQLDAHLAGCDTCQQALHRFEADRRRLRVQAPTIHPELLSQLHEARARRLLDTSPARPSRTLAVRAAAVGAGIAAAIAVLVAVSPTTQPTATPLAVSVEGDVVVDAHAHSFDRADIEVREGTTVEWRNTGATRHTLVRRLGPVTVTEDLLPGSSEEAEFSQAGVYEFFCTIHPGMEGTVTVEP
jgi:plastocyanin